MITVYKYFILSSVRCSRTFQNTKKLFLQKKIGKSLFFYACEYWISSKAFLNATLGVKITLGWIVLVLNLDLSTTPSLEKLIRKVPNSPNCTDSPLTKCFGKFSTRLSITFPISPLVRDDWSSISFANSFCPTFLVAIGLAYHFLSSFLRGFAFSTSLYCMSISAKE